MPDSAVHRRKIAESFGIDPGHESDFEFLLRKIGRDCAGAVVFTDPNDPYADIREPPKLKRLSDGSWRSTCATFRSGRLSMIQRPARVYHWQG
ncbi:hypothetical protein [Rhizobium sp. CECT 9324]|uniref:hypothetical protein n=1 Tax=Rhizobium sp. CECT 9324 TaxID=2845820 RepID=UPI0033B4AACD